MHLPQIKFYREALELYQRYALLLNQHNEKKTKISPEQIEESRNAWYHSLLKFRTSLQELNGKP